MERRRKKAAGPNLADNFDSLESKDARKVWKRIARELSTKCGTKKASDKFQKKMKQGCQGLEQKTEWGKSKTVGFL